MPRSKRPAVVAARPEVVALLQSCKETPEDDAPRLVLADWLEERGDAARAEFIRVQCELAALPATEERGAHLQGRAAELTAAGSATWLGPLKELVDRQTGEHDHRWHRGLLWVRADAQTIAVANAMMPLAVREEWAWVEALSLSRMSRKFLQRLLSSRLLRGVVALGLGSGRIGDRGAAMLAASPDVGFLRRLDLTGNDIGSDGALALARSPHLARLAFLNLDGNYGINAASEEILLRRFGYRVCLTGMAMEIPF